MAPSGRQGLADHPGQFTLTAEDFDCFRPPGLPLLGDRAGLVFGFPGFQGCLLGQGDRFDVGGLAAVVGLELLGQFGGAGFDGLAPRRPAVHQFRAHTDDFTDRALSATRGRDFGEAQSQPLPEVGLQPCVVQLGGRHHDPVQRLSVQRQPALNTVGVDGGDLVRDGDVGVQIGVTCAGVAVGERGTDQAGGVDLGHTTGARTGERRIGFQEGQRIGDRCVVALLNDSSHIKGAMAHRVETDLTGLYVMS